MSYWYLIDLAVFGCVVLLAGIIIPQILLIAFRRNLFDTPDPRKIHTTNIPRLGGISFFPAILFALLLLFGIGALSSKDSVIELIHNRIVPLCFTGCAAILLYLTGMADDLVGVKYRAKFVMQTIAAGLVIAGGIRIENLHGFLGLYELPTGFSIVLTTLIIIFIINAINLIDGIDGLASGLCSIACAFYAYVFIESEMFIYSAVAVASLGVLIPFFIFNVFGNAQKHKKIFMGDTGALTIGLFLSVMSIEVCALDVIPVDRNPAVLAFTPLLIPGMDVVRVYIHRIRSGRNPFMPDKTHIHHKLLALGMPQRRAMATIISSGILLIVFNYFLSSHINITILFFSDLALWLGINMVLTRAIHDRETRLGITLFE